MKTTFKYFLYIILITLVSCTYDNENSLPAKASQSLPDTVSFHKNVQPIFTSNCDNNGCHAGAIPSNRINLDSTLAYSQLLKSGSGYVDTINPSSSVIYVSIISVSDPMPPGEKLSDYDIQLILKWIQQGAKNN